MTESKSFTMKPEGAVTVTTGADGIRNISSEKPIKTHMDKIISYGIENLVDIRSYTIEHKDGKIFHHVVFNSGGTLDLSFDSEGKFSANTHGMSYLITEGQRVLIKEKSSK
ncbi:hypothetical protein [Kosakonia sacchari]|uniref:hypothetical protein n=1 Tax=Kosakonia sacchari TaxID=1158459 RepID=UPI0015851E4E|nr:hypothetical protein [Kosakonia sacchari]NUL36626.1 hypothetical protein [Kosakonia sacchari]